MNRRLLVLSLAVFTFLLTIADTASAGPAPLQPIGLITPSTKTILTDSTPYFMWSQGGASTFRITLTSADGKQKITSPQIQGYLCLAAFCSYSFGLPEQAANQWTWRENTTYQWIIKGYDYAGKLIAKSVKWSFKTDLLPASIQSNSPFDKAVVGNTTQVFSWNADSRLDQYRFSLTGPNGFSFLSPWLPALNNCGVSTCQISYSFSGRPDGNYKWKVIGRQTNVPGTAKSIKRTLTVQ